jgi:hypothetical protein
MKPFWWFCVVITVFWWGIYAEMREIQAEQHNLPDDPQRSS